MLLSVYPSLVVPLCALRWFPPVLSSTPTYVDTDRISGRPVTCERCPPGTFLRAGCSSVRGSQCAPCPQGSFTELWNYVGRCLRCGFCGRNQVVKKECSADSDCQCECKQGYFYQRDYDMCVRHSECASGHGVLSKGTAEKDTVCSVCPVGTFSSTSSADQNCTQQSCSDSGLQVVLKGTAWHDNVCANSGELHDGAVYLKEILPAFFTHHKIKIQRLRRILRKLLSEDIRKQEETLTLSFSELHSCISKWVSSATPMQIRQLPAMLIKMRATHAGEKLQKTLNRIDKHLIILPHLESFREVHLSLTLA